MSVLVDSFKHVVAIFVVTMLFYSAWLRRVVRYWLKSSVAWCKRLQLVSLYLEVPIVRRSCLSFGVVNVFPQFLNELAFGALKTTSLGMQPGVVRAPFCFVPSLSFDLDKVVLPVSVETLRESCNAVEEELSNLLDQKVPFDEFFGTWETFDFFL
jgi:hypothetical protein